MKILMLCEYFFPYDRGGSEWSVFHLAKDLIKKGHQVEIFTPNYGNVSQEKIEGMNICRFPYYVKLKGQYSSVAPFHFTHIGWWAWTTCCLWLRIQKLKPNIVHVHGKYFIPQAVFIGRSRHIPIIVTLRDYILLCPLGYCLRKNRGYHACGFLDLVRFDLPQHFREFKIESFSKCCWVFLGSLYGWLISRILRLFIQHADRVVGISKKLSQIYLHNQIMISGTIYNTFSPARVKKLKRASYLLYVGRLTEGKGWPLLYQAYTKIHSNSVPRLMVIGNGNENMRYESNGIEYLGHKPYGETLEYIANAQAVVVPAVWEEPFGRVAVEALLFKVPVVTTKRGGLPEIIRNQVTGLVVEPTVSALIRAIKLIIRKNALFRKNISLQIPNLTYKFRYKPIEQYLHLYKQLV